jgi:predicted phage terminase large subunit-like protein
MIFDDLENDERVATPEQRKKLKNWFNKAALPALSRFGRAIIVGTILHHDSLLANILANKDMYASWVTRMYKAIMQDENGKDYALWEEHISLNDLIRMRDDPTYSGYIGSLAFAQEYQNVPFDPDDAIVQPEWIQWADKAPEGQYVAASVITVDPAASEKTTADPTAKIHAVLGVDGNLYVKHVGNKRMSPTKAAKELQDWNSLYTPNRIGMEKGVLGLVFNDLLKGLPMVGLDPDTDKVRRLLAVSRFFESGQVFFVKGAKNIQALYSQLIEFPSGSHDDMVDALVYAIRMLLVQGVSVAEVETAGDYSKMGMDPDDDDDDGFDDDDL